MTCFQKEIKEEIVDLCLTDGKEKPLRGSDGLLSLTPRWRQIVEVVRSEFEADNLALLVGSGISHFSPSNVPMGNMISNRLKREILLALPPDQRMRVSYLIHNIPFEALMARITELSSTVAREIILMLTTVTSPNGLHRQVAELLCHAARMGKVLTVVTTNYDMGITLALCNADLPSTIRQPALVIRPHHVIDNRPLQTIFHIHGATCDPETFILDYSAEFQLDAWKKRYLHDRLKGKTLLVIGFSGWDLDVSEALEDAGIARLIWVHRLRDDCPVEKWSPAARNLALVVEDVIALNVCGQIHAVLEPLTMRVDLQQDDDKIAARFQSVLNTYASPSNPWLSLWARWTAVRAGCWDLAFRLTPNERALLDRSQCLEIEAFGFFYAGQHAKGAVLQREAAFESVKKGYPLDRYLYYKNNEAEFYNRGGFLLRTLATVCEACWNVYRCHRTENKSRSLQVKCEARNLVSTLTLCWPLLSIFLVFKPLQRLFRVIFQLLARFHRGGDLDKFLLFNLASLQPGTFAFGRGEARFEWLGQRARLINVYRISTLSQLLSIIQQRSFKALCAIYERIYLATQWAALIGDPCRLGKSWLVFIEVNRALRDQYPLEWDAMQRKVRDQYLEGWTMAGRAIEELYGKRKIPKTTSMPIYDLRLHEDPSQGARDAWAQIRRGETGRLYLTTTGILYRLGQRHRNRFGLRLRLLAMSLLETS